MCVGAGVAARPARRVRDGREAERARAGRADRSGVGRRRPALPQTFMKVGPRNAMVIAVVLAGRVGRGRAARVVRLCRAAAGARDRAALRGLDLPRAWSPRRRRRSTTCAARPRTGATRCACLRRGRSSGLARLEHEAGRTVRISVRVNGAEAEADCWEGESLLYALREQLGFPGSKNACEQGECGSCSVLLDGVLVCSCLVLAAQADGHDVTTVEGLADGEELHPVQEAFVRAGAVQCGFCTPGLVVAAADLLARSPHPDRRRDPRGALRQPLPLHRLREDLRRRSPGRAGRLGMNRHEAGTKDTLRPRPLAGENCSGWRVDQLPTQGGEYCGGGRFGLPAFTGKRARRDLDVHAADTRGRTGQRGGRAPTRRRR